MSTHNICSYGGQGDSNEYPQHVFMEAKAILMSTHNMFLWRTVENYPLIYHQITTLYVLL